MGLSADPATDDLPPEQGREPFKKMRAGSMSEVLEADDFEKEHMRNVRRLPASASCIARTCD